MLFLCSDKAGFITGENRRCLHNCEPMEQREQKPNLFGLCKVLTEEDEAKYAANAMFLKVEAKNRYMPTI